MSRQSNRYLRDLWPWFWKWWCPSWEFPQQRPSPAEQDSCKGQKARSSTQRRQSSSPTPAVRKTWLSTAKALSWRMLHLPSAGFKMASTESHEKNTKPKPGLTDCQGTGRELAIVLWLFVRQPDTIFNIFCVRQSIIKFCFCPHSLSYSRNP